MNTHLLRPLTQIVTLRPLTLFLILSALASGFDYDMPPTNYSHRYYSST